LFTALILAMCDLAAEGDFGAMTLKCWGDLAAAYGIAGCGVVSVLSDRGLFTGCEGDHGGRRSKVTWMCAARSRAWRSTAMGWLFSTFRNLI
jgi:L-fucose isomerase-like protein